jgi:Cu(I)/Ag(I) efflux system membrane protein CusA/SilA
VPGASNVYPDQVTSGQYLNIAIDRAAAARYGIGVGDVQQVIEQAIGETVLTTTIEGRRRFPVRVRYAAAYRSDPQALGRVLVAAPGGLQIPLSQIATLEHARGPAMISSENGLLLATVLLNVQGRDVGGFVADARAAVKERVRLPAGYYIDWSGRWENQEHARQRLMIVLPIVLLVIFVLLYFTYGSALEAAHVLLAVPFALTGGVYLLWALGYNFSVAVWVGFIALFGTAVQTGVVMVIYLEEAVERKRRQLGAAFSRAALREAVTEGALLRLRPKVMTVSTVIAGLLPIMWSTRPGAEVMKPLAAPVLGGMLSSLAHVLIVTPVIFFLIRERQLGLPVAEPEGQRGPVWRPVAATIGILAVLAIGTLTARTLLSRRGAASEQAASTIATAQTGGITVNVSAPGGTLRQGRNTFTVEFTGRDGRSTDVGEVHATANMTMPGMVMSGSVEIRRTATAGRYDASADFGMAGTWPITIEWKGPAGAGAVSLEGVVQ